MAGLRVALLGATGAVGREILELLEQRRLPVAELRPYASSESEGGSLEFHGEDERVRALDSTELAGCDLVLCAAPGVLEPGPLRDALARSAARLVDLSGALESDPQVPLYHPRRSAPGGRWLAVPRGVGAALGLALEPLTAEAPARRLAVVTLEGAAGGGLRGIEELTTHTVGVLGQMSGDRPPSEVFPASLAFDCLPQVGELLAGGETAGERELAALLRRMPALGDLPIGVTRVRVPVFSGSLAAVHLGLERPLSRARARELWAACGELELLPEAALPTPRASLGREQVLVGRVRAGAAAAGGDAELAFALAVDDLRRAAADALAAAEQLLG
jgi:aspartate-semialdehyde dehydrogenase